jgi:UDP-N-acetylmuramoyl-L-alanyl-D-glutamate--2,6-diaminopimelate ligase
MVAARLSDVVIVTSDNPRSEDPSRIIDDIRRGITPASHGGRAADVTAIVDRGEAIEQAVSRARAGDLVLIAGKGHEKYQVIGDRVLPFDDVAVAQASLARRRSPRTGVV